MTVREIVLIDVATGTAEVGGWTTRELLAILEGLEGVEVVGADVGEYDSINVDRD